jgi:sugar phosphate isomerase/epimerase
MATLPLALQLYTVRDDQAADFEGTLRKVAGIGYRAVEMNGYGGMSAADLKALMSDIGLQPVSTHIALNLLENDAEAALTYARDLGCAYAVCPFLPRERRGDAASYRALGQVLSMAGRKARDLGLGFAYHNHDFEFERLDGQYALDILFGATDPDLVGSEFDVYWAQYAGVNPAEYIRKLGRRCTLVHLKDMAADADRSFAEVGEGTLDFGAIIAAAEDAGAQWYIVEQDRSYHRPALDAVRLSLENLRAKGWA